MAVNAALRIRFDFLLRYAAIVSSTINVVLVRVTREMMFSRVTVNEPPIGTLNL